MRCSGLKFGERIFGDGKAAAGDFTEAFPAPSDQLFLATNFFRIEETLVEEAGDFDGREFGIDDELGLNGIAAEMPLRGTMELCVGDFADDVTEIKVTVGDVFDGLTADFAQVALIAFRHGDAHSFYSNTALDSQQPAGEPSRGEVGLEEGLRSTELFEEVLGGKVSATDRPFHCSGPAGASPITCILEIREGGLLRGATVIDSRENGKDGVVFRDHAGMEEIRFASGGHDGGEVGEDFANDLLLIAALQVAGGTDHDLVIMAGLASRRALLQFVAGKNPLRKAVHNDGVRERSDFAIKPEMDAGDGGRFHFRGRAEFVDKGGIFGEHVADQARRESEDKVIRGQFFTVT